MNKVKRIIARFVPASILRHIRVALSPSVLPKSYKERLACYEKIEKNFFAADSESDLALLRMYSHILSKRLYTSDWAPGHSKLIYDRAKSILDRYAAADDPTVLWTRGIINEYEERQMARPSTISPLGGPMEPSPLAPEDLLRQMRYRVSSRHYENRRVDVASIEKIVEASLEAPWSCSRQALRVYASVEPETARSALQCFKGFTCFSQFVPCVLVFCVDLRPYSMPKELFVPHLDVGLASSNAALMASSLGLTIVFLSWGSRTADNERRLRTQFNIPDYYEIVVGGCCGYPSRTPVRPVRKPIAKTLIWK